MLKAYEPAMRKVREFWDALPDLNPTNLTFLVDTTSLSAAGEVSVFLRPTTCKELVF